MSRARGVAGRISRVAFFLLFDYNTFASALAGRTILHYFRRVTFLYVVYHIRERLFRITELSDFDGFCFSEPRIIRFLSSVLVRSSSGSNENSLSTPPSDLANVKCFSMKEDPNTTLNSETIVQECGQIANHRIVFSC